MGEGNTLFYNQVPSETGIVIGLAVIIGVASVPFVNRFFPKLAGMLKLRHRDFKSGLLVLAIDTFVGMLALVNYEHIPHSLHFINAGQLSYMLFTMMGALILGGAYYALVVMGREIAAEQR